MASNVLPFQRGRIPVGPPSEPAVYTVAEVAFLLSLSISTTYELVRDGEIPAERLGRRWIIPRVRFHAWLEALPGDRGKVGAS